MHPSNQDQLQNSTVPVSAWTGDAVLENTSLCSAHFFQQSPQSSPRNCANVEGRGMDSYEEIFDNINNSNDRIERRIQDFYNLLTVSQTVSSGLSTVMCK